MGSSRSQRMIVARPLVDLQGASQTPAAVPDLSAANTDDNDVDDLA